MIEQTLAVSSSSPVTDRTEKTDTRSAKVWVPQPAVFTPAALEEAYGQHLYERLTTLGLEVEVLKSNRITGVRQEDARKTYAVAKRTLSPRPVPSQAAMNQRGVMSLTS